MTRSLIRRTLGQLARGVVYYTLLQFSVGVAVQRVAARLLVSTGRTAVVPVGRAGFLSMIAVGVVAALLVNRSNPPAGRRVLAFSIVAFVVGLGAETTTVGSVGVVAPLPAARTGLLWGGALLIAYAVVFEIDWPRVRDRLRE